MKKAIKNIGSELSRKEQKSILGGDPGGHLEEGNLCDGHSANPRNLCKEGLYCDVSGMNIGICKKKKAELTAF